MPIINIGGPGNNLPFNPANSYYVSPGNPTKGGNGMSRVSLVPGSSFIIPAGPTVVLPSSYTYLEMKDPISGVWFGKPGAQAITYIESDGTNYRLMNYTGLPVAAVVTAAGSGYATSSTVITPSAGGSTWQPIIGGALGAFTLVASGGYTGGNNYTLPPKVIIDSPPAGGFQATAYATLTSGAVSSITLVNAGAGYLTAPNVYLVADPNDPNAQSGSTSLITNAVATVALTGAGTLTGAICTYNGATALTSIPTLTVTGAGSGATLVAVMCWTITATTIGTAGATVPGSYVEIASAGGYTTATPAYAGTAYTTAKSVVRTARIYAPVNSGAVGTPVIGDSGLFQAAPQALIFAGSGAAPGTAPAATFTMGGVTDTSYFQSV